MQRLSLHEVEIERVAAKILSGSLVAYPTDTVYGLGCDPFNPTALARLKKAKKRGDKPLPLLAGSYEIANRFAYFSPPARLLAQTFWPGALTLVVPEKIRFPEPITCGSGVIGLRVPNHPFLLKLLLMLKNPLVGTSANISGVPPSITADEVEQQLGSTIDLILDGGRSQTSQPSTVVDVSTQELKLLRAGIIPYAQIKKALYSQTG